MRPVADLVNGGDAVGLGGTAEPGEVRLRVAARCADQEAAQRVGEEVESLYLCGPAGGGGVSRAQREIVAVASTLLPAASVTVQSALSETLGA